jgi:hypothetical protein
MASVATTVRYCGLVFCARAPEVDDDELTWHQDLKDRKVTIIEDGGWSFQMENSLPVKLSNAEQLSIPKFVWHRVIKGNDDLIVEIQEQ